MKRGFGLQSKHLISKLLATCAVCVSLTGFANALEIRSKVTSVAGDGQVVLPLPEGAMVAIGDKVRIEVALEGLEPTSIKTRWTVSAIRGKEIVAKPDGEPTGMPKAGYVAVINTIANQPEAVSEQAETASAPAETEMQAPEAEEAQSAESGSPTEQEMTEPAQQKEATSQAEATPAETTSPEPVETAEPAQAEPEKNAPSTEKPETAELRPALPATESEEKPAAETMDMSNKNGPVPEHECDRLAAHPFDPDAVAEGVSYDKLNADKIITICNEAINENPKEPRFYSQLSRGLHKAGRLEASFLTTMEGASLGSGHSMAYLGVMFKQGEGTQKDLKKSIEWFEKAAAKGNPGGMVFAAAMYRDGTGTARNYKRSAELYQQAADLNIAEAMTRLGVFYDRGHGVGKDSQKATDYLLRALKSDDKEVRELLYEGPAAISKETREAIQTALKEAGFYKGRIDGDFGPRTRDALTLFRRSR